MPRSSSAQGGRGRGYGGFGRGGYFGRGRGGGSSSQSRGQVASGQVGPANIRALNPLNQYYSNMFQKIKRDADMRGLKNQAFCYKRVLNALSKYPMPVLCLEQAQFLEGVGDTVAIKFQEMIDAREKEFEDLLFQKTLIEHEAPEK